MFSPRALLSTALCVSLSATVTLCSTAPSPPLGVLTQASAARLNEADAFAGLSVYEGEQLSTGKQGRLGLKVGMTVLALGEESGATIHGIRFGAHIDLDSGALFFTSPENAIVEVHLLEAMLRPEKNQLTQAEIRILAPSVLQIAVRRGALAFSYRQEYQMLPEGESYRIYLDAPAEPQGAAGAGAGSSNHLTKVAYFIVGGTAAGGLAGWGIHQWLGSGNGPVSPSKP